MRALAARTHSEPAARDAPALKVIVRRWASKIGVEPKRVHVQRMTTKWASCSLSGRLCFSSDLLLEDAAFQEAVIVHELLHLRVPNHGKLFRSLMAAYAPGWEGAGVLRISERCGRGRQG
ncbi:MAG: M48 family metallopeptidase [Candidatus Rokubacteria bacterium]|nr:M48 family metallopeptidase [Candidatus Rokubacteria bacterium]